MKARELFEKMRLYPDLDVDVLFQEDNSIYELENINYDEDRDKFIIKAKELN